MKRYTAGASKLIHCRTGSSEIKGKAIVSINDIRCRTGNPEITAAAQLQRFHRRRDPGSSEYAKPNLEINPSTLKAQMFFKCVEISVAME